MRFIIKEDGDLSATTTLISALQMLSAGSLVILQLSQHHVAPNLDKVLDLSYWIMCFARAVNLQSLNVDIIRGIITIAVIMKMLVSYVQVRRMNYNVFFYV